MTALHPLGSLLVLFACACDPGTDPLVLRDAGDAVSDLDRSESDPVCADGHHCPAGTTCGPDAACLPGCGDAPCPAGSRCDVQTGTCFILPCSAHVACPADSDCCDGRCYYSALDCTPCRPCAHGGACHDGVCAASP